jgi:hypothetical protein
LTTFAVKSDIWKEALKRKNSKLARKISWDLELGNYEGYEFPIVFREVAGESGKQMRDVLDNRNIRTYLISDRMRDLLIDNNITGWECYEIEMYDKKGNIVSGYNGFSVTGKCNDMVKIDFENIIKDKKRDYFEAKGAMFDIEKWDGSDIFKADRWRIITKKVYELFKKHKITAIEMTRMTDYTRWLGYTKEQALENSIREIGRQNERWEEFKAEMHLG